MAKDGFNSVNAFPLRNEDAERGFLLGGSGVGWSERILIESADIGNMKAVVVVAFRAVGLGAVIDVGTVGHYLGQRLQMLPRAILVDQTMVAPVVPLVDIKKQVSVIFAAAD